MTNLRNPVTTTVLQQTELAIRNLSLRAEVVEAGVGEELESAFAALSTKHVEGIVLIPEPFIIEHRVWIAELALKAGLPTAFQRRENVEAGGLLSYGPNLQEQWRQAAVYVDRILKGALPAEMPCPS